MRICSKCKENLPIESFYKRKDGYVLTVCKRCEHQRIANWNKANPEKRKKVVDKSSNTPQRKLYARNWKLKKNFGIDIEEYEKLFSEQEKKCAICRNEFDKLDVDHDHLTGLVRGLLCPSCNKGIGLLKENIQILKNAIGYLSETEK